MVWKTKKQFERVGSLEYVHEVAWFVEMVHSLLQLTGVLVHKLWKCVSCI